MTLLRALFIALALANVSGCAINPATGSADLVLMSESEEIRIGRTLHEEMMAKGARYDDDKVQAYIDKIGQDLVQHSHRSNLTFTFTVVDSPDINAFALPGGYIYINRGLMAYMDNEAELAAVLAHEIGHVTARHAVRQKTAATTNSVLAAFVYVATGSADVAEATNTAGSAMVAGYGRDHELEADTLGARYLHATGYRTDALLEVIGVLKDQETYNRFVAKQTGKKVASYHGVFSTHPRNDKRLQQVIATARDLEGEVPQDPSDNIEFMRRMNGLAYGINAAKLRDENRFYHNKLKFSFAHPTHWTVVANSKAIVAAPADQSQRLTITIRRRDDTISDAAFLNRELKVAALDHAITLEQSGLSGYSGTADERRVAMIEYQGLAYLFEGKVTGGGDFAASDAQFLALIKSFRPMKSSEKSTGPPQHIVYVKAITGTTYEYLALQSKIKDGENQLRLLNGHYPGAEPTPGDWIKTVKLD